MCCGGNLMLDTLVMLTLYVIGVVCILQMLYYLGTYVYDLVVEVLYQVHRYSYRRNRHGNIYYMHYRNRHQ